MISTVLKRTIAAVSAGILACSVSVAAFAQEFVDMPDNWTTEALLHAVDNGLLYGDGDKVMPDDNITRAQMAAIIVRAFGATETADLSYYTDVSADKWYYNEFSKAVAMGAFKGDGDKLNPENFITFQECFSVVYNTFFLPKPKDANALDKFSDGDQVAQWAFGYAVSLVENGYWDGIDGALTPTDYITRSEFAVLMYNLVKTYINEPGTYTEFPEGNVMIRTPGVILDGVTTDYDIIVGEGNGDNGIEVKNVTARSLVLRAGGDIGLYGKFDRLLIESPRLTATLWDVEYDYIASCKGSTVVFVQMPDPEPEAEAEAEAEAETEAETETETTTEEQ